MVYLTRIWDLTSLGFISLKNWANWSNLEKFEFGIFINSGSPGLDLDDRLVEADVPAREQSMAHVADPLQCHRVVPVQVRARAEPIHEGAHRRVVVVHIFGGRKCEIFWSENLNF